jgi:hypothetical protein
VNYKNNQRHSSVTSRSKERALCPNLARGIVVCPLFSVLCCRVCESGSSVSIVSGYGQDDRAIEVRSPAEAKESFL